MSTFNYDRRYVYEKESGIYTAPTLLEGGTGASFLPDFIGTHVDRAVYGATEGGSGRWAFGSLRTPQRWMLDFTQGWDPDVANKPDPNWNAQRGESAWVSLPQDLKAAVLYKGGDELKKDVIENSVSWNHLFQRVSEIEIVAKAEMDIDRYDRESNFINYGLNKTLSGGINYVFSDPLTVISIAATAGMAAPAAGAAAAGAASNTLSVGARIAQFSQNYSRTWKTATYLWDGLDGASSSYSSWSQLQNDGYRIYGKTFQADDSWTDEVAIGGLFGLGFSAGGDALGRMFKGSNTKSVSVIENMAANSAEGTLSTGIDHVAQSAWRSSKSRLERNLDTITGPDTELRRTIMDDEARSKAMWGSREDMDELSDWIETNKPNSEELSQHISDRLVAAQRNRDLVDSWQGEVEQYVMEGGDEAAFFRKKSTDMLRTHMGERFAEFRFILDYLEEATGDARLVAEWMAHGDKDRVLRAANAINAAKRIGVLEDTALGAALKRISDRGVAAATDESVQAVNRIHDNVTQGRFRGAVDILNEMHQEVVDRQGRLLGEVDASINALNDAFSTLNDEAFEQLDHFKDMQAALGKLRRAVDDSRKTIGTSRARLTEVMSPDADNATVINTVGQLLEENPAKTTDIADAMDEVAEAYKKFKKAEVAATEALDEVKRERRSIISRTGKEGLDRTMTESGGFPLWKVELSSSGYDAVRRSAVRQTQVSNRWKVEFVDRFLGENAADNALMSGSNPLRPVMRERPVMQRFTLDEQEQILSEELERVAPDIAAVKRGAADRSLDQKIADTGDTIARLEDSLTKAKQMLERRVNKKDKTGKALSEFIEKREKTIKRFKGMEKRMKAQLEGQMETLNKDLTPTSAVTADAVRNERAMAKAAAHTEASKKLTDLTSKNADARYTRKGRNLRDKVRRAASEVGSSTEYQTLNKEVDFVGKELEIEEARLAELRKNGATDADPQVKNLNDEIAYLKKKQNKIRQSIDTINNRPAMIKRSHELSGNAPKVADIVEISRLRAEIASAVRNGEADLAEELNRRLYNKYGDATRLPRWKELEDFFERRQNDIIDGNPTEELMAVTTDGRNIKFSVMERPVGDVASREGVEAAASRLPTEPPAPTSKRSRGARRALNETRMLQEAVESDTEAAAGRSFNESARNIRYDTSNVFDPTPDSPSPASATSKSKNTSPSKAKTAKDKAKEDKASKDKRILDRLVPKESPGERLVITNSILMRMGQVPILRGLGRSLLRLQTAGTGFGAIHSSSRVLDMMVTGFNMLDRPEALVKSLGYNNGSMRTLQNFRDQGRIAVNELAVAEQRARRSGHYQGSVDEDMLLQTALDTGNSEGLNDGLRGMYDVMRRHYQETGRRLNVSHPELEIEPNYRPRQANTSAVLARMNEAQQNFSDAYADRIMNSGTPIPDELADSIGVPRGTAYNVLSSADQAAFESAVREYSNRMAAESIHRLTNGVTEAGIGYRRATSRADSAAARKLEDAVYNNPKVRRWYIGSPVLEHKLYMETRAPQIMFDAQLSEALGEPATFDDVISAMRTHSITIQDAAVRAEFTKGVDRLQSKWEYHTGRAQYQHSDFLDAALRVSTGVVRGSFGSFWGLAGLATEVPRAVAAARMYGGGMEGMFDLLHAIRNSGDMDTFADIAHATDQYCTHAHSSFGSGVGTSISERLLAPWERMWSVAAGQEAVTNGGVALSRVGGTLVSAAEAYGETGMRLGGMQYFSGIARVVADRQAKRFISRNIDNMERLAEALQKIGQVADNTPASREAFKKAAKDAGIPYDVALQMNHSGLLTPDVVKSLKNGLEGQDRVWNMGAMRGRVDDRAMSAAMDFLTAVHNFHVPTSSLASSVETGNVVNKLFYNLTSYSRAFALNVAFRTAANGRMSTMLGTFAAVMIGENIYQSVRDVAMGKSDPDKLQQQWNDDPAGYFLKKAVKSPWLGAHSTPAMAALDTVLGNNTMNTRGNTVMGPILQSGRQFSKMLYSNEKTGKRDYTFLESHAPLFNTWYSRLITGGLE